MARGRPRTGITPIRHIRIADDLWHAARAAATDRGETLTEVITEALRRYVAAHRRETTRKDAVQELATAHERPRGDPTASGQS